MRYSVFLKNQMYYLLNIIYTTNSCIIETKLIYKNGLPIYVYFAPSPPQTIPGRLWTARHAGHVSGGGAHYNRNVSRLTCTVGRA